MSDPASLAVVDVLTQVATPALLTNENLYSGADLPHHQSEPFNTGILDASAHA